MIVLVKETEKNEKGERMKVSQSVSQSVSQTDR